MTKCFIHCQVQDIFQEIFDVSELFQCRIFFFIYRVLLNCDFHDLSPYQRLSVSLTCNPTAKATLNVFPLELNFHYVVLKYESTALLIDESFAIPHLLFLCNTLPIISLF